MKNYITVAALLAAGTAFANADVITIAENFFGSSDTTQTAEFRGYEWGKPFDGTWTADSDASGGVFGAGTTNFSVVYQYGLSSGDAAWSAGTLYYGTASNKPVVSGNDPSLTVSGGSASITNIHYTGQRATVAVIQNMISADDLKSVTDLSLNFTVSGNAVDLAVFYLADGGGQNDVKRLGLWDYSSAGAGTHSMKLDYSAIDASKNGTFVVAVRLDGVAAWSGVGSVSDLTWSGTSAIPEPSAFGLLAGLGALALVASRRRRK